MAAIDPEKHLSTLKRRKLSLAEYYVLSLIGKWPIPASAVPATAASHSEGDPRGSVSEAQCRRALDAGIMNGWLTIVDKPYLALITWHLSQNPARGPIYGLPQQGDVDFTPTGAGLFQEIVHELFGALFDTHGYRVETPRPRLYFKTKRGALNALRKLQQDGLRITTSSLKEIGPWRVYWWQSYPRGYSVELDGAATR